MPGPAPAKVQHWAVRLTHVQKETCAPVWDDEECAWIITVSEKAECSELLHMIMREETGDRYTECTDGHEIKVIIRFRRGGYRQGLRTWRQRTHADIDGVMSVPINANDVLPLLAKPTNPQGSGKASGTAAGSNRQQMSVKRTTVIRV